MTKSWTQIKCLALLSMLLGLSGCIRPKYERLGQPPVLLDFKSNDPRYGQGYFYKSQAYEAYVEFDQRGALYHDAEGKSTQLRQALDLIHRCRFRSTADSLVCPKPGDMLSDTAKPVHMYVFVHGWKNNTSDSTNNPWGFRRFLSYAAYLHKDAPVIGIYIGWPGASLKNDRFLTFWNREPVADAVGNADDLRVSLRKLLHEAKGELHAGDAAGAEPVDPSVAYSSTNHSTAIVIGHSFGGIVAEHAITALLLETFQTLPRAAIAAADTTDVVPPADLFVLINEAGAASIAKPLIDRLRAAGVRYQCQMPYPEGSTGAGAVPSGTARPSRPKDDCPLILSMTSEGDLATKLAYPGGEWLSFSRPASVKFDTPDQWGQTSTLPYALVTTGNFVAMQNHRFLKAHDVSDTCFVTVRISGKDSGWYCMDRLDGALNTTPYWVMQLPQFFVPDHGTVFQDSFLRLLDRSARGTNFSLTVPTANMRLMKAP